MEAAVEQPDLRRACLQQTNDQRPGRAARAQDHRRTRRGMPSRHTLAQVLNEAKGIAVAAQKTAVGFHQDRIDRADPLGQGV